MKTEKLSLKGIKTVLSRRELKKIMAGGSGPGGGGGQCSTGGCVTMLDCGGGFCPCSPNGECV
jgi:hypothetical protein